MVKKEVGWFQQADVAGGGNRGKSKTGVREGTKARAKRKWEQKPKQDYNQMPLGCPASALSMQSNGWVSSLNRKGIILYQRTVN